MLNVNTVKLAGVIGFDVKEAKVTSGGSILVGFMVALPNYNNCRLDYYPCKAWNESANVLVGVKQGTDVAVEGFLRPYKYEKGCENRDCECKQVHYAMEVVVTSVKLGGAK